MANRSHLGANRRVLVIGAGFSGLAAAHHLSRAGFDVEVREASDRVGGLIQTIETEKGLIETAANGFLNSPLVEDLFESVGAEMIPTLRTARARYILRAGRPRRWPLNLMESMLVLRFIFKFIFFRARVRPNPEESVAQWGARVLSPSVSRYTLETAFQGIYAGDSNRMSATLALGRMFARASKASVRRPRVRGTVSPRHGMSELIEKMRVDLESRGVRLRFSSPVTPQELASINHPVVLATGAVGAARLLEVADPERARSVAKIEMLPVVTTTVHFPMGKPPLQGFGCLFPPGGRTPVLGALMNNYIFEGRARNVLSETWIMGGARFAGEAREAFMQIPDEEILHTIRKERRRLFGQEAEPVAARVTRWPKALPHMDIEMEKEAPHFRSNRRNLFLLGNYTGGIGLARILDQAASLPEEIANTGQWS